PGPRVVVPTSVRLEVHSAQLPDLAPVVDARLEAFRLLVLTDLEPVLDEDDSGFNHAALPERTQFQEPLYLALGAEPHHALDASAVVQTAIEIGDLAACGIMLDVALQV